MKNLSLILTGTVAFGVFVRAENKVDFVKDIQPILEKRCIECHGPEKQKGKLRLDNKDFLKRTGDEQILIPGDSTKSDLYRRVTLPADHEDVMPNKGETLTKAQIDLIKEWINQGAVWPDNVVFKGSELSAQDLKAAEFKPTPAEQKAIAALESSGISARLIAMNVPWREANFHLLGSNVNDQTIAPLKDILSLVQVNLAGTKVTDAGLATLSPLTNLNRLHLEKTEITDAGLAHLKTLTSLNYLNLYGTQVSDSGLEHLKSLKDLQRLYLWQTKVTDAGVEDLQKALPKLEISRGWEVKLAAKEPAKEPAKEEKKDEKKEENN